MYFISEAFQEILGFMDRGGWVLYLIMATILIIVALLIEKAFYLSSTFKLQQEHAVNEWEARSERTSFFAHAVREDLVATIKIAMQKNMGLLKALIALCPLLGLLGTVTGMIEVFEVMSLLGGGNPKAMASGISMATMPTMAGMVAAIIGVLGLTIIEDMIKSRKAKLEDHLTFDH